MMNEYKNLIINFVKEHQKGLKIALLVFLVGGMIFKGLMQIPQINASKAEVAKADKPNRIRTGTSEGN